MAFGTTMGMSVDAGLLRASYSGSVEADRTGPMKRRSEDALFLRPKASAREFHHRQVSSRKASPATG